jgi:alginate O-acetyltransferase complex protein AlgJ
MIELAKIMDERLANNVLIGKNGYIFLRNDRNDTMAQITGRKVLTGRSLRAWGILLDLRRAWFEQQGIAYFYMAAPCKECVYQDYLPDGIKVSDDRPVTQLMRHLEKSGANKIIYPLNELMPADNRRPTYPTGDSHWNWYGAYLAYIKLMEQINQGRQHKTGFLGKDNLLRVLNEDEIEFRDERMDSDLSSKLGLTDIVTKGIVKNPSARVILRNNVSNIGNYRVFENKDKRLPKAVIFRDSFSNYMMNYLAESFSRLVVVWQPNIDYSIVKAEKPDIVISQQAERFMVVVPDELGGSTNRGYVAGKIKDGIVTEENAKVIAVTR